MNKFEENKKLKDEIKKQKKEIGYLKDLIRNFAPYMRFVDEKKG